MKRSSQTGGERSARRIASVAVLAVVASLVGTADAAPLSGAALLASLRRGGDVLVMRHTSSPQTLPDATAADPQNLSHERQLDAAGRASATAMGQAIRALKIPVASVVSSPTYRARQTVTLLALGPFTTRAELGDGGVSMSAVAPAPAQWLRTAVATPPAPGGNTLLVTHQPNMAAAFADQAAGLQDGETLVFQPDGKGGAELVAHIRAGDWAALAP